MSPVSQSYMSQREPIANLCKCLLYNCHGKDILERSVECLLMGIVKDLIHSDFGYKLRRRDGLIQGIRRF
jgi:hypothetical protein